MLTPMAYFNTRLWSAFYRRRRGFLFFSLSLVVAAGILLWPARHSGQAARPLHNVSTDQRMILNEPKPTIEMVDSMPSPTPTFPPLQTPTPLPIPNTGLVLSRNTSGAYLWESPDGKILTRLPNGTEVNILDKRSSYGNLPWVKVHSPSGDGWILLTQVFRENKSPVAYIMIKDGTFLRDQPRGGVQQALFMGTPIMKILDAQEIEGRTWVQVKVLDGAIGWVAEEWLSAAVPANND